MSAFVIIIIIITLPNIFVTIIMISNIKNMCLHSLTSRNATNVLSQQATRTV